MAKSSGGVARKPARRRPPGPEVSPAPSPATSSSGARENPRLSQVPGEFFFATVKAVGTPIGAGVVTPLKEALEDVDYTLHEIKLSDRLYHVPLVSHLVGKTECDPVVRYRRLISAGDYLRAARNRPDALAVEAVAHLSAEARAEAHVALNQQLADTRIRRYRGVGYLFKGLMHPAEADRLRSLYESRLFVIAAYYPQDQREIQLGLKLAHFDGQRAHRYTDEVAYIARRDRGQMSPREATRPGFIENRKKHLNVTATFPKADLFVDARDADEAAGHVRRLVQLIFGHPFQTPTTHEIAMAAAYHEALQSTNPARRVGAALVSEDGDILSTGTNEVPAPGGGIYESGKVPDYRDHQPPRQHDPSDLIRRGILRSFIEALVADPSWIEHLDTLYPRGPSLKLASRLAQQLRQPSEGGSRERTSIRQSAPEYERDAPENEELDVEQILLQCIRSDVIWNSELFDVIEYSRGMHAEMDAITSAARKGVPIKDATMYCTTLPCHECARLIIGSGITKVYFIEPYEKSRTQELYSTEIDFGMEGTHAGGTERRVHFLPYVGISPSRFDELFSWVPRKCDDERPKEERLLDGQLIDWSLRARDGKVRRSIITNDALYSRAALRDLQAHEETVIKEYKEGSTGAPSFRTKEE